MGVHQKCIGATGQTATGQMATEQMATEQIGLVWIDRWVLVDRLVRLSIDAAQVIVWRSVIWISRLD